jgi:FkbM family methyltransferase
VGHVQAFNLKDLIARYNLCGYIETGTGIGDSLSHALLFQEFKELYSVEIDRNLYDNAIGNFQDSRLKIVNDKSKNALKQILSTISRDENYLFFLDAHFPEADFGTAPDRYQTSFKKYGKDALPLEEELSIIKEFRPQNKDVLIIDDVWIYESGPFQGGNWSERETMPLGDMSFVSKLFDGRYNIKKDYKQQGYLLLTPTSITHDFQHIIQSSWLADLYKKYLPQYGFFVEIGMGHTTTAESRISEFGVIELHASNTIELLQYGWKGIFIEPVAEFCYEAYLLLKNEMDRFKIINIGASDRIELCTMYGEETMIPNGIFSYKDGATKKEYNYPGKKVLCKPTSQILSEANCPHHIDLMSIDVEGVEEKVLKGLDFNKYHPSMLIIESNKTFETIRALIPANYTLMNNDGLNACWIDLHSINLNEREIK